MRVFVTGASGLIGSRVCGALVERGDEVIGLSRSARPPSERMQWARGDESDPQAWEHAVAGSDAVVNLAGESVFKRWNRSSMRAILRSRVGMTTALHDIMASAVQRPRVMVSMSAVGYYGTHPEKTFVEGAPQGDGFLAAVCGEWEAAARRSEALGVRVALPRTGVVLASRGGALPLMAAPVRAWVGGAIGSGRQWVSWIHIDDLAALILRAMDDERFTGPVNAVAPEPVRQRELMRAIGRAVHRPIWLDAPGFAVKLAMGRMADEMLLHGQRVSAARARELGFEYRYPDIDSAVRAALLPAPERERAQRKAS